MERDYQANRDLLYKCFKPKSTGLFTYIEGSETRVIDYKVEGIDIDEAGWLEISVFPSLPGSVLPGS